MSNAIANLIRVHRLALDERRRTLTELERLADRLQGDLAGLEAELEREQQLATESPEMAFAFPAFASAAKQRKEKITRSIAEVSGEIARARARVEAAFQELKKYEMARDAEERRKSDQAKRREQAALDEMGLSLFMRRQSR